MGFFAEGWMKGGSVTEWITHLKAGEIAALAKLHKRYWPFLVRIADRKLQGSPRRAADEEDVAQEAFLGFFQSLQRGGFPKLENRHHLMAVLAVVTARKAAHQIEHAARKKRGGGDVYGESVLESLLESGRPARGLEQINDDGPTPQEQIMLADYYERCMAYLPKDLRPYAQLYLAGHSYSAIAQKLGRVKRTVERKVPLIVRQWQSLASEMMEEK